MVYLATIIDFAAIIEEKANKIKPDNGLILIVTVVTGARPI
jgi:hypothetical protein